MENQKKKVEAPLITLSKKKFSKGVCPISSPSKVASICYFKSMPNKIIWRKNIKKLESKEESHNMQNL
jgi:hypothetical protein